MTAVKDKTAKADKLEASSLQDVAPDYWEQACKELMKQDRILKKLIPKYGSGFLVTRGDPFNTLARAIVGQQISVAAAQSVWEKVLAANKKKVTPNNILALSIEELRAAGLS
ncbi:MAG TPA: DNA-3-methyladenine glycosylase, partial [Polynucleobacter sp.]|nr:DNA-3-methyladenine glycosylase [Polynucleobacter sp.]